MLQIRSKILTLDVAGVPRHWVNVEHAAEYYTKKKVAWEVGDFALTLRGGIQRSTGLQSELTIRSIVAIRGTENRKGNDYKAPVITRRLLFQRDCMTCAYCGGVFSSAHQLEMEHIVPVAQGGKTTWTNLTTSCTHCNDIKGNRTPAQADMPLRYQPYVPSRVEALFLANPHMLPDQRDILLSQSKNFAKHPRTGTTYHAY